MLRDVSDFVQEVIKRIFKLRHPLRFAGWQIAVPLLVIDIGEHTFRRSATCSRARSNSRPKASRFRPASRFVSMLIFEPCERGEVTGEAMPDR
jgi:hypothetical protein